MWVNLVCNFGAGLTFFRVTLWGDIMRPHEKYIDAVKVVLSPLDLCTHLTLCIWSPDLMSRGFRRDLMPAFLYRVGVLQVNIWARSAMKSAYTRERIIPFYCYHLCPCFVEVHSRHIYHTRMDCKGWRYIGPPACISRAKNNVFSVNIRSRTNQIKKQLNSEFSDKQIRT